jgi:hypothetical protein
MSEMTGIVLGSVTPKSVNTSQNFALLNGRKCGVTNSQGRYTIDIPPGVKCRVIALLPPDTVLSAQYRIGNQFAGLTDAGGDCWCVSNVDTVPNLMVVKSIDETGTIELLSYPEVMGMTICVELNQEN